MSSVAYDWFAGLATIGGFLYFMTGFATAYAVACIRARLRHTEIKIRWQVAGIAVGVAAIIIVTLQTQVAYNTAKDTAEEVQQCQREFNDALRARARITAENDELSQAQRRIIFDWIHALLNPPPPINTLETNDPRRQQYGLELTADTERLFRMSLARQDQLQTERERNPLPDPTCGKA